MDQSREISREGSQEESRQLQIGLVSIMQNKLLVFHDVYPFILLVHVALGVITLKEEVLMTRKRRWWSCRQLVINYNISGILFTKGY